MAYLNDTTINGTLKLLGGTISKNTIEDDELVNKAYLQDTIAETLNYTYQLIPIDESVGTSSGCRVFKYGKLVIVAVAIAPAKTGSNITIQLPYKPEISCSWPAQVDGSPYCTFTDISTDGRFTIWVKSTQYHRCACVFISI